MNALITERLTISPLSNDELNSLIQQYKKAVPELSMAYQEMLDACLKYPEEVLWYTAWKICLKDKKVEVGFAGFKGFNHGCPEIGYGIDEGYEGNGYATEAVIALCGWAFCNSDVAAVEAETALDNQASKRVLRKCGFIKSGEQGEEGPRYRLKKDKFN